MSVNFLNFSALCPLNSNTSRRPPQRALHIRHISCSVSAEMMPRPAVERRSAKYQPTIWSYDYVQSLRNDNADEMYRDKARKLEEEVRCAINDQNDDLLITLELIDDIQRLGLANRFEKDIERALDRFHSKGGCNAMADKSPHATALGFRLLRQHGYEVSQSVFVGFMDHKCALMACLTKDMKGMLSLYEASHLGFEGEDILEKARAQTRMHLENYVASINIELGIEESFISHALELPVCRQMLLAEARWYIEAYNKKEDANGVLLQLAKIHFNIQQAVLQKDLQDSSRWWGGMGLASKLSFARDRLMECFFWALGMVCEPQYSNCRKVLAKVAQFITTFDDVYDVYGALDELELLTDAVERWDVNAINDLPDYMKLCFLALYNTINEVAYDTLKEHGENVLPYLTRAWSDLLKAFLQEAKWLCNNYNPTYEEYLENAWISSSGTVLLVHAYVSSSKYITKKELEGLGKYHDLLRWPSVILRLCNDFASSPSEQERGETANSLLLYMNENGLSEDLASECIRNSIEETWKKMNREKFGHSLFPRSFVETAINLARTAHCVYQYGDGHSAPDERSRKRLLSLIIEPISLADR